MEVLDGNYTSESECDSDDDSEQDSDEFEGPNIQIDVPAPTGTGDNVPAAAGTGDNVPAPADTGDNVPAPADTGDNVPAPADTGDVDIMKKRNAIDSGILQEFQTLSAKRFADSSSEMKPFFAKINNLFKVEHKKIASRQVFSSDVNYDDVPIVPPRSPEPEPMPSTSTADGIIRYRPERKKMVKGMNDCWEGSELWVFWPSGSGVWSSRYWQAFVSNDAGENVTLSYTGEWEGRCRSDFGFMDEAVCSLVESKETLLKNWSIEVPLGFSL